MGPPRLRDRVMSQSARVAAALSEWHRAGRRTRSPISQHPEASVGGQAILCPSYPIGEGIGAICIVSENSGTEWLLDVVGLDDARVVAASGDVRTTGPCLRAGCAYWRDSCQLGAVVASATQRVTESAEPPCPIRERCRWHREQGPAACGSCEGLVRLLPIRRPA
jgi:hypothetical protein